METRHQTLEKFKLLADEIERLRAINLSLTAQCQSLNEKNTALYHNEMKLENENQKLREKLKETKKENKALRKQLEVREHSEEQAQIHSLQDQLKRIIQIISDEHHALIAAMESERQSEENFEELEKEQGITPVNDESSFNSNDMEETYFDPTKLMQDDSNLNIPTPDSDHFSSPASLFANPFVLIAPPRLGAEQSISDSCKRGNAAFRPANS